VRRPSATPSPLMIFHTEFLLKSRLVNIKCLAKSGRVDARLGVAWFKGFKSRALTVCNLQLSAAGVPQAGLARIRLNLFGGRYPVGQRERISRLTDWIAYTHAKPFRDNT
jgi:hypothetical protein